MHWLTKNYWLQSYYSGLAVSYSIDRLLPGTLLFLNTEVLKLYSDDEIRAACRPYHVAPVATDIDGIYLYVS